MANLQSTDELSVGIKKALGVLNYQGFIEVGGKILQLKF